MALVIEEVKSQKQPQQNKLCKSLHVFEGQNDNKV
jgi:hypothetical protein